MASNIQNTGISNSTPSTGGTRSNVVRVFDIVLDANHAIFRYGGVSYDPTLLGMIFYGDKDLDVTSTSTFSLPKALPKVRGKYPVINELVKIETGPSPDIYTDIGGNNSFNYVYYGEVVPVHGNAVHNALPSQKDLASTTPTSEESVLASNGTQNQSQPNEVSLDNTGNYQPKDDVRNLQPFAGDVIREGRAGQTIRMGTTNKEGTNNWSDGNTFGDPVMILRVGQSENQQGSTIVEDVNGDASSIYMFANQKLNNIQLTTTNFESCQATYTEATVPTVQLAVAPILPIEEIPNPLPEQEIQFSNPEPIVETSPPQVTSSFSDDELEDPVFAALAEAEEEGLIEVQTYEFEILDPNYISAARPVNDSGDEIELGNNSPTEVSSNIFEGAEIIPLNQIRPPLSENKPTFTPVYTGVSRKWTQISIDKLSQYTNLYHPNIETWLKTSILFVALKEQRKGSSISGWNFNHYGIMADLGPWGSPGKTFINGSVISNEGSGGQGIRTSNDRFFASFLDERNGTSFMKGIIKNKTKKSKERLGITYTAGALNKDNILDFYILKWLAPSDSTVQKLLITERDKYLKKYQSLWEEAEKYFN